MRWSGKRVEREREREREKRGRRFSMQHYFEARREDPISYGTSSAMDFTGEVLVLSIGSDRRDCPNLAPDVIRYLYLLFILE